jgi:hypothetical protein
MQYHLQCAVTRMMYRSVQLVVLFLIAVVGVIESAAQSQYQVISVVNGGTVSGTVRWTGPLPHSLVIPISKDQEICDPEHHKSADLERLVIGPSGGVANTVFFSKMFDRAKAWTCRQRGSSWIKSAAVTSPTSCWFRKVADWR